MKRDNENNMKKNVEDLEEEITEENELVEDEGNNEDNFLDDEGETELEEKLEEEITEENELVEDEENNEDKSLDDEGETELEEKLEEEITEENELVEDEENNEDKSLDDVVEIELEEIIDENEKEFVVKSAVPDSDIRKIGDYIIEKLLTYKYVLLLDFAVFILLFFLIPSVILEVKPYIWMTLFLIFTILPTMAFYIKDKFKDRQIMFGILFFYLCILCILDQCTLKDLYGITSHGTLDNTPAWLDAIFVTFIIVFFQYLGILVINLMKKLRKKKTRK